MSSDKFGLAPTDDVELVQCHRNLVHSIMIPGRLTWLTPIGPGSTQLGGQVLKVHK